MAARRAEIDERRMLMAAEGILRDVFARERNRYISPLVEELNARRLGPHTAAKRLLEHIRIGRGEGDA